MADPESPGNATQARASQVKPPIKRESYVHFLLKPLLILCLLIAIPSFPSKPPDFIHQPILAKLWELLYLSFIGIAVCYGVFSRRNAAAEAENHPIADNVDAYLGNLFGSDEKREIHPWNPQYVSSDPLSSIEGLQMGSAFRRPTPSIPDLGTPESIDGSGPLSESQGSFESFGSIKNGEFSDLGFENANFEYMGSDVMTSPVPWGLRSGRMAMGEDVGADRVPSETMAFPSEEFRSVVPESWSVPPIRSSFSASNSRQEMDSFTRMDYMLIPDDNQFAWMEESKPFDHGRPLNFPTHSPAGIELESQSVVSFPPIKLPAYSSLLYESSELSSSKLEGLEREDIHSSSHVTSQLKNSGLEELEMKESAAPSSSIASKLSTSKAKLEEEKGSISLTLGFPSIAEEPGGEKSVCSTLSAMPSSMDRNTDLISDSCQYSYVSSELNAPSSFNEEGPGFVESDMKPRKGSLRGKSVRTLRRRKDAARARKCVEISPDQIGVMFGNGFTEAESELMMGKVAGETGACSFGGKQNADNPVVEAVESQENFQDQNVEYPAVVAAKCEENFCGQSDNMMQKGDGEDEAKLMGKDGDQFAGFDHLSVGVIKQNVDNFVLEDRRLMVICPEKKDEVVQKRKNKAEARKIERRSRRGQDHPSSVGGGSQKPEIPIAKLEKTVSKYRNGSEKGSFKSDECSKKGDDNGSVTSKGMEETAETDTNEIDNKAGEFIAKFKEQMRVEKVLQNEVDTKAGEFIAKFKEQIRLEKTSKHSHGC